MINRLIYVELWTELLRYSAAGTNIVSGQQAKAGTGKHGRAQAGRQAGRQASDRFNDVSMLQGPFQKR